MAYIGNQPALGNFVKLDAITTSATDTYNLLNGGVAFSPGSANQCIVSLNGVIQEPTSTGNVGGFTISGSTIVFTSALTSVDVIDFILVLGSVLNLGTPSDGTVTTAKLAGGLTVTHAVGAVGTPSITFDSDSNTGIFSPAADTIAFTEGGAEAMRIDSSGKVLVGLTSTPTAKFAVLANVSADAAFSFENASTTGFAYNMEIENTAQAPDDNVSRFLNCFDNVTERLIIFADGDVKNHDNSYGGFSDERIKQDIRDSNSQWNDIKNIRVRNFKKKDDVRQYGENAWEQIGLIAQELETVSPKLIKHTNPTSSDILSDASFGTLYEEGDEIPEGKKIGDVKEIYEQVKGVSYSVLYMKAIKALQEAMERIETLEAKVTTLENN